MRVWGDPWLPNERHSYIQTPLVERLRHIKVNCVRDVNISGWEEDVLIDLFIEHEKRLIMQIPWSRLEREDNWMWDALGQPILPRQSADFNGLRGEASMRLSKISMELVVVLC